MAAVVLVPERAADERFPVLVTFHGLGEAKKGAARGARGWIDDYGLLRAIERLRAPPLTAEDLQDFVDRERLAVLNRELAREPYRGLIVVNSYTPDVLRGEEPFSKVGPLTHFVTQELLPRVQRETPALPGAAHVGIDGVSLGGRAALAIALSAPAQFRSAGGLQPAFDVENASEFAALAGKARRFNPELALRLLSSEQDYFLAPTRAISRSLERAGIDHRLVVWPGPHDYPFNRGPAAYEMLIHHDRVLRGRPPP
jgi:enterochelin esterase-like enzyme